MSFDRAHKIKVAVLMGGPSAEHAVSLKSGRNVMKHLDRDRYFPQGVIISEKGEWSLEPQKLRDQFDVALIAMHGSYGEDGVVQSILDGVQMPYTGSPALPSALAMNKFLTLRFLREHGVRVPLTLVYSRIEWHQNWEEIISGIKSYLNFPLVIKPNRSGSSLGVTIVLKRALLREVLEQSFKETDDVVVQPFTHGREFTCAVLDHGLSRTAYALPPTEIVPLASNFFDYGAKYDSKGSLEITPARLPESWLYEIKRTAVFVHRLMGLRGMSRSDLILGDDWKLYFLEVNTIPGLTEVSLLPKAAAVFGISFPKFLDHLIQAGFLTFHGR